MDDSLRCGGGRGRYNTVTVKLGTVGKIFLAVPRTFVPRLVLPATTQKPSRLSSRWTNVGAAVLLPTNTHCRRSGSIFSWEKINNANYRQKSLAWLIKRNMLSLSQESVNGAQNHVVWPAEIN